MKKMVAIMLGLVTACSLLVACGNETVSNSSTSSSDSADSDVDHIIVTWVYYSAVPEDMEEIQEAVNEMTIPEIGVEVEFMPISFGDTMTKYSTMIASGEQMDCMLLLFQDPTTYYNNGSVYELNDLISEYGSTIGFLANEYPIYAESSSGDIYGIAPVDQYYGYQTCIFLKGDYVDAVTLNDDPDHVYTLDELGEIFAELKAAYPDTYPFNVTGNSINSTNYPSMFASGIVFDNMGSGVHSGILMGTDSTEIVDYFETEEYYNYLQTVKEWYDAGYILPDAVTTDSTAQDLIDSGVTMTLTGTYNPITLADQLSYYGEDTVALKTSIPYYQSTAASSVTWTIPVTSEEPEAAMKFMNMVYEDSDLMNLIQWGIEGTHYELTDEEGVIAFPEGVDATNSTYYNSFGVWGDRRNQYVWNSIANKEANKAFTEAATANPTVAGIANYRYDTTNMTNQLAAIDTVINQYLPALECGAVSDLEKTYNEFINALKVAGIDEVIADNQAQLDEYLEENGISK